MPYIHSTSNSCDAHSAQHVQVFHHTLLSTLSLLLNLSDRYPTLHSPPHSIAVQQAESGVGWWLLVGAAAACRGHPCGCQ